MSLVPFLKSPHFLFSVCDSVVQQFKVSIDPLTVTDMTTGRVYCNEEEVIEDSSGPRMHLFTTDGLHRLELPFYGVFPPFHGYFVVKRRTEERDAWNQEVWECVKHGKFVALPLN